jgi:deazaflavin-dependent oxidoreductase (nitroreductase family)
MPLDLGTFTNLDYCYLTTTGRVTGRPHTIEIWFALNGQTLYMLSGNREKSDWVKNLRHAPDVKVRLNRTHLSGQARVVAEMQEDALARRLVVTKYTPRYSDDLTEWGKTALPVAVDLSDRL